MTEMTPEAAQLLRKAFPAECVGKLPKAGQQFDFVSHAYVRDRLLSVDPSWSWTPLGVTEGGAPLITVRDSVAELWINLTVCGVTKPGVGVEPANKSDLAKCLLSDAIRNAAMSFGVALDLWMKGDPEGTTFHAEQPEPLFGDAAVKNGLIAAFKKQGWPDPTGAARDEWEAMGWTDGPWPQSQIDKVCAQVPSYEERPM